LIIEGSDKVGKSTVCRLLSEKLGIPVIKMKDMPRFFKKNPEEASEVYNKTIVQFKDFSFIQDRGFPSSIVYSIYYNRRYPIDYIVHEISPELKAKVFILNSKSRCADEIVTPTEQDELREIYNNFARIYGWNIIDCENLSPEEICNKILEKI